MYEINVRVPAEALSLHMAVREENSETGEKRTRFDTIAPGVVMSMQLGPNDIVAFSAWPLHDAFAEPPEPVLADGEDAKADAE